MTLRRMPVIERPTREDILALGAEWEELRRESSVTSPFLTWPWVKAWLETEGAPSDLVVAMARDADTGALVGIAPFYVASLRRGGIPIRELRLLGSGPAAPDHLDLIVRRGSPPDVANALWGAVVARPRWHRISLDGVTAGGHLAGSAVRRGEDRATDLPCPYLPLDGGWDVVVERFDGRLRKNLDRYGRKLDRDTTVTERMIATSADLDDTFDHLIRMHQSIRNANGDAGVFARPEMRSFLRAAAHGFLDTGRLRLWRLDAAGAPIAIIWCVRSGDSVAFYATGYDTSWSKYGPGRRIMARAIRGAIDEGATEFDFLRGDESYKRLWGTRVRHDLVIRRPSSPRGRLLWIAGSIQGLIRRLLRRSS